MSANRQRHLEQIKNNYYLVGRIAVHQHKINSNNFVLKSKLQW